MTQPRAQHRHFLVGLGLAVVGAVFFSAKAILAKLLYREGLDAVSVLALRMLLSVPFFVVVALWTWRRGPPLLRGDLLRCLGLGLIGYYASSMLDFMGLQYITAGLERLILFLTPSFVLLLNRVVLKRAVSGQQWLSLGVAYAGIVLVFQHDVAVGGEGVALGAALVLASAFTYAVYLLLSGELLKRVGTLRLVALAMTASSVAAPAGRARTISAEMRRMISSVGRSRISEKPPIRRPLSSTTGAPPDPRPERVCGLSSVSRSATELTP